MDLKFQSEEVAKLRVTFPNVTREKLERFVESFAEVVDFSAVDDQPSEALATLKFRAETVIEGAALNFGQAIGVLRFEREGAPSA